MNASSMQKTEPRQCSRREFLLATLIGGGAALSGLSVFHWLKGPPLKAQTFIGKATNYETNLAGLIQDGFRELGLTEVALRGKRILLKPNLVEPNKSAAHINTHPLVVRAAIEAFFHFGASAVLIGEGTAHNHDNLLVLEESGMAEVLIDDRIPFHDLNSMEGTPQKNMGGYTPLPTLTFPHLVHEVDMIVSVAKMKTHHWAGATLSMKNFFGVMPGLYYGWPKNVLHQVGITHSILDINATLKPHFAIVDGITGMQGDGPIMGDPVSPGVLVMGSNLPAVDATCCRIMAINPERIDYLRVADQWLGPIADPLIAQHGESWQSVQHPFALLPEIPAQRHIRLEA